MKNVKIQLEDTANWGCQGSDADRDSYEQAVADAIGRAYPGADVSVSCAQIARPSVVVTTRGADGRILTDEDTCRSEEAITENVLAIAAQVWEDGSFWESEVAS